MPESEGGWAPLASPCSCWGLMLSWIQLMKAPMVTVVVGGSLRGKAD